MSNNLGALAKRDAFIPQVPLSAADTQALRAEVRQVPFLHWKQLAVRWGVSILTVKHAAGNAVRQRYDVRTRNRATSPAT